MSKIGKNDLSYLNAFNPKIIREARRIIYHGITVEDIDEFLGKPFNPVKIRRVPKEKRKEAFKNTQWGRRTP